MSNDNLAKLIADARENVASAAEEVCVANERLIASETALSKLKNIEVPLLISKNLEKKDSFYSSKNGSKARQVANLLVDSFAFTESSEGFDFWYSVYNRLLQIADIKDFMHGGK